MEKHENEDKISGFEELKNLFDHLVTQEELESNLKEIKQNVQDGIQKKPLLAVGVALGVGFLLGVILKK
ncbi:MAG: DUF883 C-terminal domain-containing protein [Balneolales bacterium]|nr:DUF883 C-terminal domain-containing protein [Balneolales bacterium]